METDRSNVKADRELLELAAKAAGFHDKLLFSDIHNTAYWHDRYSGDWGEHDAAAEWNPRTDDGDCARLEATLGIDVAWQSAGVVVVYLSHDGQGQYVCEPYADHAGDKQRARRAAVLLASAAIGMAMS